MERKVNLKPNFQICETLPDLNFKTKTLVIYDKNILLFYPELKAWLKKQDLVYGVHSGESLKEVDFLSEHLKNIQTISEGKLSRSSQIVAVGGGSVGDFAGFIASIWKRGLDFYQIPSTWLSAVDSAHGGKNALNLVGIKNQIGSFHFPKKIFLVKDLLQSQPLERKRDAYGEIIKMAFIDKGKLYNELLTNKNIWSHIEKAIKYKYRILKKDPYETEGIRYFLNFGHTMGHVVEVLTHLTHGKAVVQGMWFALNWSLKERFISRNDYNKCVLVLKHFGFPPLTTLKTFKKFEKSQVLFLLREDKKIEHKKLSFVFLKGLGKPMCEQVSVDEIVKEAERQGWLCRTQPTVRRLLQKKAMGLSKMQ